MNSAEDNMEEQSAEPESWNPDETNDLRYGGVTVAEFQTADECSFAIYLLSERGIKSGVLPPYRDFDFRFPQVRVSPDDEGAARQVLAQSLNAANRAKYDAESDPEPFETPHCPKCRSTEVVLDAVGNGNSWRCEICGKSWTEMADPDDKS